MRTVRGAAAALMIAGALAACGNPGQEGDASMQPIPAPAAQDQQLGATETAAPSVAGLTGDNQNPTAPGPATPQPAARQPVARGAAAGGPGAPGPAAPGRAAGGSAAPGPAAPGPAAPGRAAGGSAAAGRAAPRPASPRPAARAAAAPDPSTVFVTYNRLLGDRNFPAACRLNAPETTTALLAKLRKQGVPVTTCEQALSTIYAVPQVASVVKGIAATIAVSDVAISGDTATLTWSAKVAGQTPTVKSQLRRIAGQWRVVDIR